MVLEKPFLNLENNCRLTVENRKRARMPYWTKDAISGRTLLKVKNISASILGCNSKAGIEIIYGLANYV